MMLEMVLTFSSLIIIGISFWQIYSTHRVIKDDMPDKSITTPKIVGSVWLTTDMIEKTTYSLMAIKITELRFTTDGIPVATYIWYSKRERRWWTEFPESDQLSALGRFAGVKIPQTLIDYLKCKEDYGRTFSRIN